MRFTNLLTTALLPLAALSSPVAVAAPVANPGEIVPNTSGNVPGTATWYCTFTYEILFEHFTIEAHKWGVSEKELKELIPGPKTSWDFQRIGEGWSDFLVNVRVFLVYFLFFWGGVGTEDADFRVNYSSLCLSVTITRLIRPLISLSGMMRSLSVT